MIVCWLMVKEMSLFMGEIIVLFMDVFLFDVIKLMGECLMKVLFVVKYIGVFEKIRIGMIVVCLCLM